DPFRTGYVALLILVFGQLINAGMGCVVVLLNMTGHERDTLNGVAVAAVANLLLNFLLIPRFGINGAAASTAVSLALWNILLARTVAKRLGLSSGPLQLR